MINVSLRLLGITAGLLLALAAVTLTPIVAPSIPVDAERAAFQFAGIVTGALGIGLVFASACPWRRPPR